MQTEINKDTLLDFEKKLIEMGGVYKVNDDRTISSISNNNELVTVMDGKTKKPVVFFYSGALVNNDHYLFNPFKESLGNNAARNWFYGALNSIIGLTLKSLIIRTVRDTVAKVDDNYKQFPVMSRIVDKVDQTMIDEIDKIRSLDFILVFYNRTSKTAEAQCAVLTDEFRSQHSKFRKKTWDVIEILIEAFLGTLNISDEYQYTATIMSVPETDAKLHVMLGLVRSLNPWARDITGLELHSAELDEHLEALEGYAKLYAWLSQNATPVAAEQSVAPWNQGVPSYAPVSAPIPVSAPTMLIPTSSVGTINQFSYAGAGSPSVSAASGSLGLPPGYGNNGGYNFS